MIKKGNTLKTKSLHSNLTYVMHHDSIVISDMYNMEDMKAVETSDTKNKPVSNKQETGMKLPYNLRLHGN